MIEALGNRNVTLSLNVTAFESLSLKGNKMYKYRRKEQRTQKSMSDDIANKLDQVADDVSQLQPDRLDPHKYFEMKSEIIFRIYSLSRLVSHGQTVH